MPTSYLASDHTHFPCPVLSSGPVQDICSPGTAPLLYWGAPDPCRLQGSGNPNLSQVTGRSVTAPLSSARHCCLPNARASDSTFRTLDLLKLNVPEAAGCSLHLGKGTSFPAAQAPETTPSRRRLESSPRFPALQLVVSTLDPPGQSDGLS